VSLTDAHGGNNGSRGSGSAKDGAKEFALDAVRAFALRTPHLTCPFTSSSSWSSSLPFISVYVLYIQGSYAYVDISEGSEGLGAGLDTKNVQLR